MKSPTLSLGALGAIALASASALAAPIELTQAQMDRVVAGAITTTTTQFNNGGHEPNGKANGVPIQTVSTNPTGKRPPGQNK